MNIAIIAEYNPFHKGHEYQINEARRIFGENSVISIILGGIFSQRGEPYVAPPYIRAEAAMRCGADLVVEMPFPFSCAPASIFARAGVEIAEKIGADILLFGSECGDIGRLSTLLERLDSEEIKTALASKNSDAIGKTRAYAEALGETYKSDMRIDLPNDILAVEYLRAIKKLGAKIKPYAILRKGDYKSGDGEFPSASSLRRKYSSGGIAEIKRGIPKKAFEVFEKAEKSGLLFPDIEKLNSAVLLKLANEPESEIAFSSSGISGRLRNAAKESESISELLSKAATKRYTDAELSRAMLYTLLSVKKAALDAHVLYTKLLAANSRGRAILNNSLNIELLTKPADTAGLSAAAKEQYLNTFLAERAYALCLGGRYEHLKQSPKIGE